MRAIASVSEFLRDWVLATVEAHLAELLRAQEPKESTARACVSVGSLLCQFGKLDRAAEVYESGRQLRVATSTLDTPEGAELLKSIGTITCMQGDLGRRAGAVYGGEGGANCNWHPRNS